MIKITLLLTTYTVHTAIRTQKKREA